MEAKKAKKIIEKHSAFKKFYAATGEDYDEALEIWMPRYNDLVDVYSEEAAAKLIKEVSNLKI